MFALHRSVLTKDNCSVSRRRLCSSWFPEFSAAGRADPVGHGDLGECERELLPATPGLNLQPRDAVRQRGLFQYRRRGPAGPAGAPGLLWGSQGEQVSAANGR